MLMVNSSTREKLSTTFYGVLIACPIITYFTVLWQNRLNGPQGDDFIDILWFFEIFFSRTHWLEKLDAITLPIHEHISVINHLTFLTHYALFQQVNFFHYTVIGHGIVLLCCLTLARWLKPSVGWLPGLAIAVAVYLNLHYWDSVAWAITAIANQAVILFALLAAFSFHQNPHRILVPLLWALAACLSQFNGLIVLFALCFASFSFSRLNNVPLNTKQIYTWLLFAVLTSIFYLTIEPLSSTVQNGHLRRFIAYTEPELIHEYHLTKADIPPSALLTKQLFTFVPATLLGIVGASALPTNQTITAVFFGFIVIFCIAYTVYNKPECIDRFNLTLLFFCLSSIGLIAIGRGWFFGPDVAMLSRYRMYSFLMILLAIQPFFLSIHRQKVILFTCCFGIASQLASVWVIPAFKLNRTQVADSLYHWMIDGGLGRSTMTFYPHNQDQRLFNAVKAGFYNPYAAIPARNKPASLIVLSAEDARCLFDTVPSSTTPSSSLPDTVFAYSKKPSALATEITIHRMFTSADTTNAQLIFCGDNNAMSITLSSDNFYHVTTNSILQLYPLILLKTDLPAHTYRVFLQTTGAASEALGTISFR